MLYFFATLGASVLSVVKEVHTKFKRLVSVGRRAATILAIIIDRIRTNYQMQVLIATLSLLVISSFELITGRKIASGKVSMLIFILAAGYLFAVYILLAIAKRSRKRNEDLTYQTRKSTSQSDVSVARQVGDVISSPGSILNS